MALLLYNLALFSVGFAMLSSNTLLILYGLCSTAAQIELLRQGRMVTTAYYNFLQEKLGEAIYDPVQVMIYVCVRIVNTIPT